MPSTTAAPPRRPTRRTPCPTPAAPPPPGGWAAPRGAADGEPLLGGPGAVPPWDLTDAIDHGRTAEALDRLHRMLDLGGRHPLVVLASLHNHYTRMLRLDGSGAGDERSAA